VFAQLWGKEYGTVLSKRIRNQDWTPIYPHPFSFFGESARSDEISDIDRFAQMYFWACLLEVAPKIHIRARPHMK
jgi:hypothetical protein